MAVIQQLLMLDSTAMDKNGNCWSCGGSLADGGSLEGRGSGATNCIAHGADSSLLIPETEQSLVVQILRGKQRHRHAHER